MSVRFQERIAPGPAREPEEAQMDVRTVETPQLGDRSYLVHDGEVGVVVDVQRDIGRMQAEIESAGVRVTHVVETHIHNDYVSGGLELARQTGAEYVVAAGDDVLFDRKAVGDGDTFETGGLRVTVLATPGHTVHHLAYAVEDTSGGDSAVFTGGNLLYGSVGRTDLVDADRTDELTRKQYRSARMLAERLKPETQVYPTHGFGSFCSSGPATVQDVSTIAEQAKSNNALVTDDEDAFVRDLMEGLAAYPSYYAHMGPANLRGAGAPELDPPTPLDADALRARLDEGAWVIDLRDRKAYAARHAKGSVSFELSQNFTTYFGWVLPWDEPVVLVGESPEQVHEEQVDLARIGVERARVVAAATGPVETLVDGRAASYPIASWEDLSEQMSGDGDSPVVLDVRRDDEFAESHLEGAVNIPIHELIERVDEAPPGRLWVHCGSGYRAAIASSILERSGRDVVHVDDDWDRAAKVGLPIDKG
jgi:glyoxylase-like metal-dependent hydrolase (beta-lactamase superfamily II)/rhodanese-related sulfurtransferase